MKLKSIVLSIAMMAGVLSANAQEVYKGKDVFVGIGAGAMSVMTPGFNAPTVYGNLQVGGYITPVWGVRGVIGGPFQTLNANAKNAFVDADQTTHYSKTNKLFGELNFDAMLNLSNIWAKDLAKVDFYIFAGPTMNLSSEGTRFSNSQIAENIAIVENANGLKARFGATAGIGLGVNITKGFALALEGRMGVTPSVFGDADACRKAEGTGRVTLNAVWTIGGKHGKFARAAAAAAAAGYLSKEAAEALAAEAVAKNPKIVEKIVEKEVIKEVEKLVNMEVPASTAVFFEISKATLTSKDKARLQLLAESIIATPANYVFEVAGYADKKTGSAKTNMTLSEKRANTVYNFLVSCGVPAEKLVKTANGGVDALFFNNDVLSRTVIVRQK